MNNRKIKLFDIVIFSRPAISEIIIIGRVAMTEVRIYNKIIVEVISGVAPYGMHESLVKGWDPSRHESLGMSYTPKYSNTYWTVNEENLTLLEYDDEEKHKYT